LSELYDKVEEYVRQSFTKDSQLTARGIHSIKTKEWLLVIYPEATEAMQIAAVAHDIDSAFIEYKSSGGFRDPEYLEKHQTGAANTIREFLISLGVGTESVEEVEHLVVCHEVGGDNKQNLIKDADSLGFFDRDMSEFLARHYRPEKGKKQLTEKIDWMYDRITSKEAKNLARPMYEEAMSLLEKI